MADVKTVSKLQLASLMSLVVIKPFSFELIFPFINQFLLEIGVVDDPADAGYYGGLAESSFAVAQLVTVFPTAWVSDIYGRKPILLFSATGVGISMGLFGFSTKFWMILACRIIGGLAGGARMTFRVMGSEMAHSRDEESWILTLITIVYRIGQVIGQPVGGLLSHPERRWPKLFDYPFWRTYPYALPCLAGSAYALTTALVASIVLKETLPSKRSKDNQQSESLTTVDSEASEQTPLLANPVAHPHATANTHAENTGQKIPSAPAPPPSFLSILTWPLISVFVSTVGMAFITEMLLAVYPLFCFTPVELGGLGLSEAEIGIEMSVRSVFFVGSLFLYTPAWKRIGRMEAHRISFAMWMPVVALLPILNWVARGHAGGEGGLVWYTGLFALFIVWSLTGWSWPSTFLLISEHTRDPYWSATVQACLQVGITASQALGPALGGALFAFSANHQNILNGCLIWVVTFILAGPALLLGIHSFTLSEASEKSNTTSTSGQERAA